MPNVIDELEAIFKNELKANDLRSLKKAFSAFISGTEEETAVAEAIAGNAKSALAALRLFYRTLTTRLLAKI